MFTETASALDTVIEQGLMEFIDVLHEQKTAILIAERLSTVAGCEQVLLLDHGRVEVCGQFESAKVESIWFQKKAASVS